MKKINILVGVISVVILSLFTFLPLLHPGFFNFHDNTQVVRVHEMGTSLSNGMFPVRWVEGLGYGYGYPIFNFYAPLPYYVGGFFTVLGVDALFATKLMFIIGIALSGISMYLFCKKFFGDIPAILCAVLYAYFPYHAVNIYVRGAVGEFFAYAFLPIIFLGIYELLKKDSKHIFTKENVSSILKIGFGFALIALSHNLTLFMVLLLMLPMIFIFVILSKGKKVFLVSIVSGLLLGVFLSAFYTFPAFLEMRYTNVSSQVGGGADFREHFVCISQYWNSIWGYGGSTKDCLDGLSFKLGKINILLIAVAISVFIFALYKKKWGEAEKIALGSLVLLAISVILTLSISKNLWETIPYMAYLQYPWRFINFIGFFSVVLIGYLLFRLKVLLPEKKMFILCGIFILVTIITSLRFFVPQYYVNYQAAYYTQPNYIKYTVSKISDEYMPSSFSKPRSLDEVPIKSLELINTVGTLRSILEKPGYLKSTFNIEKDGVIHINRAYFPAWHAYENGREVPIVPSHDGMNVSVRAGEGLFELKFQQTFIEVSSNMLSLIAFIAIMLAIISLYIQSKRTKKKV